MSAQEQRDAFKGRRHSGTGRLVYVDDTDNVGVLWCTDCQQWMIPDQWREPCSSTKERRKGERRKPDAPPPAPAIMRWRCRGCGEIVAFESLYKHGGKYEHSGHQAPGEAWLLWCGPVVEKTAEGKE